MICIFFFNQSTLEPCTWFVVQLPIPALFGLICFSTSVSAQIITKLILLCNTIPTAHMAMLSSFMANK